MDPGWPYHNDPVQFKAWLYDRLSTIPGTTWGTTHLQPLHSSYNDWHAWGTWQVTESLSYQSSNPSSPLVHLRPDTISTTSTERQDRHDGDSPLDVHNVVARVSRHPLRLERQYQMAKTHQKVDPHGNHHMRALQLFRLPPRHPSETSITVILYECASGNALREFMNFGPNFYLCNDSKQAPHHDPTKTADGNSLVGKIDLNTFLDFAIKACKSLQVLHEGSGFVHGELRGDAFLYDLGPENGVRIMNLGSGVTSVEQSLKSENWTSLAREKGSAYKLQFVAPEQTGRMPVTPDGRADIYSLGILFWNLLTGELPFHGHTPLEVIQSVLGRRVILVTSKRLDVPDALATVIQKQIQRDPEARYHSLAGLEWDLIRISELLGEGDTEALADFKVATHDANSTFTLPNILCGRDKERQQLLNVIESIANRYEKGQTSTNRAFSPKSSHSSNSESQNNAGSSEIASQRSRASPAGFIRLQSSMLAEEEETFSPTEEALSPKAVVDKRMSSDITLLTSLADSTRSGSNIGAPDSAQSTLLKHASKYRRKGRTEVVIVSGATGMGKTTLVTSITPDARSRGYFASSKFDSIKSPPFEPVLKAMASIMRQIFSESDVHTEFHNNLRSFVRPVWMFVHQIFELPENLLDTTAVRVAAPVYSIPIMSNGNTSSHFAGRRPSLQHEHRNSGVKCGSLGHTSADWLRSGTSFKSSRFIAIFLDLLRFISGQRFVLLCLDDLQFADEESLEIINGIILARIEVGLILTLRDRHHVQEKVKPFLNNELAIQTNIDLQPLSEENVSQYVSATLSRSTQYCFPLVAVILEKSGGNPFLVREMLEASYRKKCIYYSYHDSQWKFDLDKLFSEFESHEYGSRIKHDYLVNRLMELPPNTRLLLAYASLLGGHFSFEVVKTLVLGYHKYYSPATKNPRHDRNIFFESTRHEILVRSDSQEAVAGLQNAIDAAIVTQVGEEYFDFVHDRFIQAARHLPEANHKQELHYQITVVITSERFSDKFSLYAKAAHINSCIDLIKERIPMRAVYRDILFQAGEKAIESGGRAAGIAYFNGCVALLQDDPWNEEDPDVSFSETLTLTLKTAEARWYQGQTESALSLLNDVYKHSPSILDRIPGHILESRVYSRRGDADSAGRILSQCLGELGINVPSTTWEQCDAEFKAIMEEVQAADLRVLLDRPQSRNARLEAIGSVLTEAMAVGFWSSHLLFYQLTIIEIRIFLREGTLAQSGMAFVHFATICISRFNLVEYGYSMGDVALTLLDKNPNDIYHTGRGLTLHCMLIGHFGQSFATLIPRMEQAMEFCMSSGDRFSALLIAGHLSASKLWCSHDLYEVESFCSYGAEELWNWQDDIRGGLYLVVVRQFARALQGKTRYTDAEDVLCDKDHDTTGYLKSITGRSSHPERSLSLYACYRCMACYMFGHYTAAIEQGESVLDALPGYWSNKIRVLVPFFLGLAYQEVLRDNPDHPRREEMLQRTRSYRQHLLDWSTVSDINFAVYSSLLAAQLAESEGKYDMVLQHYEQAQDHSELHSLVTDQALASELYAEFMIRRGVRRPARASLRDAIALYRRVSAFGKAEYLASKHEWLLKGTSSLHMNDAGTQTSYDANVLGAASTDLPRGMSLPEEPDALLVDSRKEFKELQHIDSIGLDILDLQSILESTQVLSSELDVDRLLSKLTRIVLDSTNAEIAAIIVQDEDETVGWTVSAIADADGNALPYKEPLDHIEQIVAKQVLLYSLRFRETVLVPNILEDERFSNVASSYRKRNPNGRSILCMPLIRDAEVLGGVYVEGVPHRLKQHNLHILRMLAGSISISITNATLFKRLEKVSASNQAMIESQKHALAAARDAERKARQSEAKARDAEMKAKAAEAQTMQSVKIKEEAVRAKTTFLANTSHELRTPLNGVIGMSELLKSSSLTQEQEGYADSIRVCADTLLTVINDILDFSKLEAGKMQLFSVPLSLTETIGEVVRALSYSNMEKDLKTDVDLQVDENMIVMGDPVRLHQILMNLLSNAYKFTNHGKVTVRAILNHEDDQGIVVTCSVEDSGIGISEEQKKKLFLPFSQADSSTTRSHVGTGLGLSICKAIIKVMKGEIWLESKLGVGTTVYFKLPFAKTTAAPAAGKPVADTDPMAIYSPSGGTPVPSKNLNVADLTEIPRSKLRICIAEDNPINQKIAKSFVQKMGLECQAFADGRQALDALTQASVEGNPFHIVLMDVQMPVLDGYNATREIREHKDEKVRNVLVIAMTASAIRGDREKCLEAGMNNYLAKPVRQQVLRQMLDSYIAGDQASVPPMLTPSPVPSPMPEESNKPTNGATHSL